MINPSQTVAIFQKQPEPQEFAAGQVIFTEGDTADRMYGIIAGEVEIFVDGRSVETIGAGDVFGVGALIEYKTRMYTAIAKTDCKLAYLDHNRFLFAIQETPMFSLTVIRSYSDRLLKISRITANF